MGAQRNEGVHRSFLHIPSFPLCKLTDLLIFFLSFTLCASDKIIKICPAYVLHPSEVSNILQYEATSLAHMKLLVVVLRLE